MIERLRGTARGRNRASACADLVWAVATAGDPSAGIAEQTRQTLAVIENNLAAMRSDKRRIVSATVYIADVKDKAAMDAVWCEWLGDDPDHWPQRACVGVALEGGALVEVAVTAVRGGAARDE